MTTQQYIFDDADSFRTMANEFAMNTDAIQKIKNMTDGEILALVNKHIDELQITKILSDAQDAALTEIEQSS